MNKADAIELFGSAAALARAVGLSRGRISQWPASLTQKQEDLVMGAALRLKKIDAPDGGKGPRKSGCAKRRGGRRAESVRQ